MMTEAEIGMVHFENGGGLQPRNTGGHYKLKKARKWIPLLELPKGASPADILILAQ